MKPNSSRVITFCCLCLAVAQLLLVLVSWLLSASMTEGIHALLSSEGIRWFFGRFTSFLASPLLVWLLLLSMAWGTVSLSGLSAFLPGQRHGQAGRDFRALRFSLAFAAVFLMFVASLTLIPHAVLLSATGHLFPSPFTEALIPLLSFGIVLTATVYGYASGHFTRLEHLVQSLYFGISQGAPLFLLYVLLIQFYESLMFVFH